MSLPETFSLLKVSPEFIRDNQYKDCYHVVDEIYEAEEFARLEERFPQKVCTFFSGKRCFFLQDSSFFTPENSPVEG